MQERYFNHHATRTAIEVSVDLEGDHQWTGTGFLVQVSTELEEGAKIDCLLLISNKHVLAEGAGTHVIALNRAGDDGQIRYGDQDWVRIDRSVHRYTGHRDGEIDLACFDLRGLALEGYDIPVLTENFLEDLAVEKIGVGSDVLYAGFPNGMKDRRNGLALMRRGSIASIPTMDCDSKGLVAIDGTVLPGNSGGPVFVCYEGKYRLLGVVYAMSAVADDYGFVIKQQYVKELIDDAVEKSANELRAQANTLIRERLATGEMRCEVQRVTREVWEEITKSLDKVRIQGA